MDKTLKSKQVFNYLFNKANQEGIELTQMKAIKLVYFCHAWYLGFKDKPLLLEDIQAWRYGAVVPSLYQALKIYGADPIQYPIFEKQEQLYLDIYIENGAKLCNEIPVKTDDLSEDERMIIDAIWRNYKNLTAAKLSSMMHQSGTPWTETWDKDSSGHAVIPEDMIKRFYKSKVEASNNE